MSSMPMKLILTQEVPGLGGPGDVVDVAPGYGRNYLIPRGAAMPWTRGAGKQVETIKRARSSREIRSAEDAEYLVPELGGAIDAGTMRAPHPQPVQPCHPEHRFHGRGQNAAAHRPRLRPARRQRHLPWIPRRHRPERLNPLQAHARETAKPRG